MHYISDFTESNESMILLGFQLDKNDQFNEKCFAIEFFSFGCICFETKDLQQKNKRFIRSENRMDKQIA